MEIGPVLKIDGKRYKARRLKFGAYREIMLIMEEVNAMDEEEFKEAMVDAIKISFGLSKEEADNIDTADLVPTFQKLAVWVQLAFTSKVKKLPNEMSPAEPSEN